MIVDTYSKLVIFMKFFIFKSCLTIHEKVIHKRS